MYDIGVLKKFRIYTTNLHTYVFLDKSGIGEKGKSSSIPLLHAMND